jgi:uncharacterized protein (DUF111 family)
VGLGSHCLDRPNLLRALLLRPLATAPEPGTQPLAYEQEETLLLQEAQIDDATAEDLAFLAAALRHAGALEVFSTAITMKKGRQGTLVSALAPAALAADLRLVWWRHGTSLGVREQLQRRWCLPRQIDSLATPLGPVRIKYAQGPDGEWRAKAEHGDLAHLAHLHGLSLREVRRQIEPCMQLPSSPPAVSLRRRTKAFLPRRVAAGEGWEEGLEVMGWGVEEGAAKWGWKGGMELG